MQTNSYFRNIASSEHCAWNLLEETSLQLMQCRTAWKKGYSLTRHKQQWKKYVKQNWDTNNLGNEEDKGCRRKERNDRQTKN